MAQSVVERFSSEGNVNLASGPPIEDGFYYDFELPRPISDEDLAWIEERMRAIIQGQHKFSMQAISYEEAKDRFKNQPFKMEIIEGLKTGGVDENGNARKEGKSIPITIYQHDSFVDLCRGPHVQNSNEIDAQAVKLLSVAGAYWRGDEGRPMLQRIYATAWLSKVELEQYLARRAEAEKRDHRKIGQQLELFHFDPSAPGMPYWLPNGMKVLNELLSFWRREHEREGYQEISSPLINEKRLWQISGHWDHYKENMFLIPVDENITYGVKPMNCPNAMVVFNLKPRSYKELPLRLSDCDFLHRRERSGTLHGLLRVQKLQQDDAHIFLAEDMIEDEYARIIAIADRFYGVFGLKYSLRLGTRPSEYIGDIETWNRAETALRRILARHAGKEGYSVAEGDGAFYGPKIDIVMEDALGRSWQMGTIQLDFQLPRRFDCKYIDADGKQCTPVVVHRVIYGALERFIGILLEHTAGALPAWLSPIQVCIIPIADKHSEYAQKVSENLLNARLRVRIDQSKHRMEAKIRTAQLSKIPYMLIVGDREMKENAVSLRLRNESDKGMMKLEEFVNFALQEVVEKTKSIKHTFE